MARCPPSGISTNSMNDPRFSSTEHLRKDLNGRSVRGGFLTIGSQGIKFFIQIGSTAILARLLVPADFGMFAMVMAVVGSLAILQDGGLSMATVQEANITHNQVTNLFWVNLALGVLLMAIVASLSPAIAWFFDEPRLKGITLAIACWFFLISLTIQHQALLQRQMQYAKLIIIQVTAMATGVVSAIVMAMHGAGYWSLVAMQVVDGAVTVLLSWMVCPWRPGLPRMDAGIRKMLTFGGNLSAAGILDYLSRNLDNILIGRVAGAVPLGFYNRAYRLMMLPVKQINWPLTTVAIPALSSLQNDPEPYRTYYRNALEVMAFAGMPLIVLLFLAAEEVILLILGNQWQNSVIFFKALGPAVFMATTNVATSWIYISLGRADRLLRWGLFGNSVYCICILIGMLWGPFGVALAVSVSRVVLKVPALWYCYQGTGIRLGDYWDATWKPTVSSLSAGFATYLMISPLPLSAEHPVVKLCVTAFCYLTCYIVMFNLLPKGHARFGSMIAGL